MNKVHTICFTPMGTDCGWDKIMMTLLKSSVCIIMLKMTVRFPTCCIKCVKEISWRDLVSNLEKCANLLEHVIMISSGF